MSLMLAALALLVQDKVKVEIKVEKGQTAEVEYVSKYTGKMKVTKADKTQEFELSDGAEAAWTETVLEVRDGAAVKVEQSYRKFQIDRKGFEEKKGATSLEGKKIVLSDSGERRAKIEATGVAPEDLSDIGLRAEALRRSFPADPIAPGATWEINEKEALADANDQDNGVVYTKASLQGTFLKIDLRGGIRCALVRMAGELKGKGDGDTVQAVKIDATYAVDLEKKYVVEVVSTGTVDVSGPGVSGGGKFESTTRSRMK